MPAWEKYGASRLGRSIVTAITSATSFTTPFGSQTRQVRITHTQANGIWFAVTESTNTGTSPTVTAASSQSHYIPNNWIEFYACSPGQACAFISTSTTTGLINISEML